VLQVCSVMRTTLPARLRAVVSVAACLCLAGSCVRMPDAIPPEVDVAGDLNAVLDAATGSRADPGCTMELIVDRPEARRVLLEMLRSASDHIHVETLSFDNDEAAFPPQGVEFLDLLAARLAAGVRVKLLLDPLAQHFWSDGAWLDTLRAQGAEVLFHWTPAGLNAADPLLFHQHKKLVVVDGREAIVGGMNFGLPWFGHDADRDTIVRLAGPVVGTLQREFLADWTALGGAPGPPEGDFPPSAATGDVRVRAIDQRPSAGDFDINALMQIALRRARRRVDLTAPYFNPTPWLADELRAAAARGVAVRVLTNARDSSDQPTSYFAAAWWFGPMLDGGVQVFVWDRPGSLLHSKTMVADDELAMVGSYNSNWRSIAWDAENAVVFTDAGAVRQVADMIAADFAAECVRPVTREWLDAVAPSEAAGWSLVHLFGWVF